MTKRKNKKASDFSKAEIRHIALQYANRRSTVSDLARYYKTSEYTIRKLLEKAVIESIVDLETVNQMEHTAERQARSHAGEPAAIRSNNHYSRLREERENYSFE